MTLPVEFPVNPLHIPRHLVHEGDNAINKLKIEKLRVRVKTNINPNSRAGVTASCLVINTSTEREKRYRGGEEGGIREIEDKESESEHDRGGDCAMSQY